MKPKIKPRNPYVAPALFRKAGVHEKPFKTERRAEKMALMKVIKGFRNPDVSLSRNPSLPLGEFSVAAQGSGNTDIQQEKTCKQTSFDNSSIHRAST
jgi:hypothetical protein